MINNAIDSEWTSPERYVAPEVAAEFLATTRRRVVELVRRGLIPGYRMPGSIRHEWRFKLSELDAAMHSSSKPFRNTIPFGSPRVAGKRAS